MNNDEFWKQVDEVMSRSIENSSKSIFDDYIRENAKNRANVGISAKIVRKLQGENCEWCRALSGVYKFGEEPKEVYQRHDNCDCTVEYFCTKGRQNVWGSNDSWLKENEYKKKERLSFMMSKTNYEIFDINTRTNDFMGLPNRFSYTIRNGTDINGNPKYEIISIKAYKNDLYENTYVQTNSINSQRMAKYLNDYFKINNNHNIKQIVIAKNKALKGISSYDNAKKILYMSEELIDGKLFGEIVDSEYFAAISLDEIIIHECDGHAKHWESIYKYMKVNNISDVSYAKYKLEYDLRDYVKNQIYSQQNYLEKNISLNAYKGFFDFSSLNEAIADARILMERNELDDEYLAKLVNEVLNYDA